MLHVRLISALNYYYFTCVMLVSPVFDSRVEAISGTVYSETLSAEMFVFCWQSRRMPKGEVNNMQWLLRRLVPTRRPKCPTKRFY